MVAPRLERAWPVVLASVITALVIVGLEVIGKHLADFEVYSVTADALVRGDPLYDVRASTGLPFTYPPFAAVLLSPLTMLPYFLDQVVWTFVSALGLVWFWRYAVGPMRLSNLWLAALVFSSVALVEPIRQDLRVGNISLLVALMVLVDLAGRSDRRWRGVLTGVAIGIKLTPAVFVPFFVITKQWRALANTSAAFAATVAIGAAIRPGDSLTYWTDALFDNERYPYMAFSPNQSVSAFFLRLFDVGVPNQAAQLSWLLVCAVLAMACLVAARLWWLRGERVLAVSLTALLALFAAPLSWLHHWVWVLPLGIALYRVSMRAAVGKRAAIVLTAAWFFVFSGVLRRGLPVNPWDSTQWPELDWSPLQMVLGHAYLWAAVLALGYLIVLARRIAPEPPVPPAPALGRGRPASAGPSRR